jgi:sugar O-acyltransferase (sialic acid O-acetyltransferase NeuD family)
MMAKKLIIFGAGETATIAAEFFTVDSNEQLQGFVIDDQFYDKPSHHGLPISKASEILEIYPPSKYKIFVAVSYAKLNRQREGVYKKIESLGYEFASYISTKANVWRTATIGKNCMIFEGNNIQHGVHIENNVILWSGNHLGHGSKVKQSAYLSSHVCVAGFAEIGERSFIGINASITDYTKVAEDCFVSASALINRNTTANGIYTGIPAERNEKLTAKRYFKVGDENI